MQASEPNNLALQEVKIDNESSLFDLPIQSEVQSFIGINFATEWIGLDITDKVTL